MTNITKVNFSGASSTGKTTITQYCADFYGDPCSTEKIPEYMVQNNMQVNDITNDTFLICSKLHSDDIKEKEKLAHKYLFIDSGPLIFYLGNKYSFGRDFSPLKTMALEFYKEQDIIFVCDTNIPFETKQIRGDEGTKDILQQDILRFLSEHDIEYTMLTGNVQERADIVDKSLINLEKSKEKLSANLDNLVNIEALNILGHTYLETNSLLSQKKTSYKICIISKFIFEVGK